MNEGNDPFVEAQKLDGKHHGFYRQYLNHSSIILRRAIRSLQKRSDEHRAKIAHPERYIADFADLDPRQQEALLQNKWPQEVAQFNEQIAILRGILIQRGESEN